MSEYDLLLTHLEQICEYTITTINEDCNGKLKTPLTDALNNIKDTKTVLDELETSFSSDEIYKLFNIRAWKSDKCDSYDVFYNLCDTFYIENVDLRYSSVRYYFICEGKNVYRATKIKDFLNAFTPI